MSLKTMLFLVMLIITIGPLSVYVYSIGNYSDFIAGAEHTHKKTLTRTIASNIFRNEFRNNVMLIGSIVTENSEFISLINDNDADELVAFLESAYEFPGVKNSGVELQGFKVYDENNLFLAGWDNSLLHPKDVSEFIIKHSEQAGNLNTFPNSIFETDADGLPVYLMIYPIISTNYSKKLVITSTGWNALIGISNTIEADYELRAMNEQVLFQEKYINPNEDINEDRSYISVLSENIPYGNKGHYVTMVTYANDRELLLRSEELKYTSILVAFCCMIVVWFLGTYALKVNLFHRMHLLSQSMKNIVDGKPNIHVDLERNDEFSFLGDQLQQVIDYTEERMRISDDLKDAIAQA
ncbi:MAG: hypothetical protein HOM01_01730, partial [Kordiimonadaceae bacterium]|nr:hypothetical protein [Kordiimonadaceae bacterium]